MKRRQKHRLGVESLENRELLTSVAGYSYDAVGNLTSIVDDSNVPVESRDGDLDIYVTNGPGTPAATDATFSLGGSEIQTHNQLWGDGFLIDETEGDTELKAKKDMILKGKNILQN